MLGAWPRTSKQKCVCGKNETLVDALNDLLHNGRDNVRFWWAGYHLCFLTLLIACHLETRCHQFMLERVRTLDGVPNVRGGMILVNAARERNKKEPTSAIVRNPEGSVNR